MKPKTLLHAFLVLFMLSLIGVSFVYAGISGKISGIVTDAESKDPLPGVNVILEGTQLGAATGVDGSFMILNVPPGVYTVRMSMMGYTDTRIENIRVRIDLTTAASAELQQTVLDAGEAVTIVAERPLVQRDMTSSMASVGAEEIEDLPVESVADVLELQSGVVREGDDFHIRGGRANEVTFWVDGVEVTDSYSGRSMGARVENDAVQELQVVSGTFNAEYGKAMSGIVNIITKEGAPKYAGKVNVYAGDYYSSDDVYSVLKSTGSDTNHTTGEVTETEDSENPLDQLNLTLNTDFSLSGPVPFAGDKLTFFTNGRYISREGYIYGREWFTPQGLAGDSSLVAVRPSEEFSGMGKLTYQLSSNLKINYLFMGDKGQNDRYYTREYRYVPGGVRQGKSWSMTHMLSWTHTLSVNTFYEVRMARMKSHEEYYLYEDPTSMPHWLVRVSPDSAAGITEEFVLDPSVDTDLTRFNELKQNDVGYEWFIDPNDAEGYIDPDLQVTEASYSFYDIGTQNNFDFRDYGFWNAKLDLTSQINPKHQIKAGLEVKIHELERDSYTLIAAKTADGTEEIVPWTPQVPEKNTLQRDYYSHKPREFSAYLQDKIELKEMIVNIGLRFDYFDANTTMPVDQRDPDIYNPLKKEHIYKNYVEPPSDWTVTQIEEYEASLEEYTPEERKAFMRQDVDPKMAISPRIGIAYPVTDKGIIHFSYGHFLGMPGFQYLYNNSEYKLQTGGGRSLLGNPDLEPEKTVHYELGLQQQLGEDIALDVTLFYKDTRGWVGVTPLKKTVLASVSYSNYRNEDYSNVYGMTFEIEKRFSNLFSSKLYYTYQVAEGTYSNPNDAYDNVFNSTDPDEPRKAMIPMAWDQRHTLNAFLTLRKNNWILSLTGRYLSGEPYTPEVAKAEITGASSYVGWTSNSERKPSYSSVDLRLVRTIPLGSLNLRVYTQIYNLFDQRGQLNVYGDTGTADYSVNLETDYPGYSADRVGSYGEQTRRPEWYQAPREIQLGLSLEF